MSLQATLILPFPEAQLYNALSERPGKRIYEEFSAYHLA